MKFVELVIRDVGLKQLYGFVKPTVTSRFSYVYESIFKDMLVSWRDAH